MQEVFKEINYMGQSVTVSNIGTVIQYGKLRKWRVNQDGYVIVTIKTNNNLKNQKYPYSWRSVAVHRLVGIAFVPNPNNLPEINHKDYNRANPKADNLEWITHRDNVLYSLCNKPNVSGINNPNYDNRKLSKKYKTDKELSKAKQGRPQEQNGRAVAIKLYCDNQYVKTFSWVGGCCEYLIEQGVTVGTVDSVRGRIYGCIRTGRPYKNHYTFQLMK